MNIKKESMNKSKPHFLLTLWKRMKKGCGEMKGEKKKCRNKEIAGRKRKGVNSRS